MYKKYSDAKIKGKRVTNEAGSVAFAEIHSFD
jgi:hypothetical protein